jgi:hypothetical protein
LAESKKSLKKQTAFQQTAVIIISKKYTAFFETCKDFFAALDFAQSSFRTYP